MRRVRIAILGRSPCPQCNAACCRQNGHEFAALLRGEEVRRFRAFAIDVVIASPRGNIVETVLPYVNGACQFLSDDNRCNIYADRPEACREFECAAHFARAGVGRHGEFLQRNQAVRTLLEQL